MSGPVYFGPAHRPLFGWLSPASSEEARAATAAHGVVLCNPFGYEAMCMHRAYRYFAEAFAHAGFPALRFDYHGTGDSSGKDRDPQRLRAWLDSIHAAAAARTRKRFSSCHDASPELTDRILCEKFGGIGLVGAKCVSSESISNAGSAGAGDTTTFAGTPPLFPCRSGSADVEATASGTVGIPVVLRRGPSR